VTGRPDGAPAKDPLGREWERVERVTCVVCPGCAFTFDAAHVTQTTGQYDCPCCENEALVAVARAAQAVTEHHFDTCDLELGLSPAYPCSCGIDSLRLALARLDGAR